MRSWLTERLGDLHLALAGFWGALVYALQPSVRKAGWFEVASILVTGTACAHYLGAVAVRYTGAPELATGFVVGIVGMFVVGRIIAVFQAFRLTRNGNGHSNGNSGRDAGP